MRRSILAAACSFSTCVAHASNFATLHQFAGGTDGAAPEAPLIEGPDGTFYGTTSAGGGGPCFNALDIPGCGTVFALTPPAPGKKAWRETVLYSFASEADGYDPVAGLVRDDVGNLYGTTQNGGNGTGPDCGVIGCGTVFRLSPPAPGQTAWTKTTLYNFQDGDSGAQPVARLILDPSGALLGTAELGAPNPNCFACGVIFRLAPPVGGDGAWSETTLHAFKAGTDGANPAAGLLQAADGTYFGTTTTGGADAFDCEGFGCGTVFQLLPPKGGKGKWHEHVLHRFFRARDGAAPNCDLIADGAGNLYGTSLEGGGAPFNGGTVWRLSPAGNGGPHWTLSVLHAFGFGRDASLPDAGVILGPEGTLFGTTLQTGRLDTNGSVFSVAPPGNGQAKWRERVLYDFPARKPGSVPMAAVLLGSDGELYGTSMGPNGTIFSLPP